MKLVTVKIFVFQEFRIFTMVYNSSNGEFIIRKIKRESGKYRGV